MSAQEELLCQVFRQRQQLGCAAASLLVATDTLHKSLRAARTHPLVLCEFTELFIITKQDDQSQHTTRRAKINATGFGPWRSRGHPTHPTTRARDARPIKKRQPTHEVEGPMYSAPTRLRPVTTALGKEPDVAATSYDLAPVWQRSRGRARR